MGYEMKQKTQELVLVLENSMEAHFPWSHVEQFRMTDITRNIEREGDVVVEYECFGDLHIVVNDSANDQYLQFGIFPCGNTVFDQVITAGDIAQVVIADGQTEETFFVDEAQEVHMCLDCGNLVVDIS